MKLELKWVRNRVRSPSVACFKANVAGRTKSGKEGSHPNQPGFNVIFIVG